MTKTSEKILIFVIILEFYTLLAALMTYPHLIFDNKSFFSSGDDPPLYIWYLWWFKKSIVDLHVSPYFTDYIFCLSGIDLAFTSLTPFNSMLSIPLQLILGLYATYNFLIFISFVIGGFGGYLLTEYLTKNKLAGLIGGVVFAFSPYHLFYSRSALSLASIEWIPFYIYFLLRSKNKGGIKNIYSAGIFLFLSAISSWFYFSFLIIFTIFYLSYLLIIGNEKEKIKFVKTIFLIFLISFMFVLPFAISIIQYIGSYGFPTTQYLGREPSTKSLDITEYFIPQIDHPIFGSIFSDIYQNYTGDYPRNFFIGYTVLLLIILSKLCKDKKLNFWYYVAIFSFLISLGPIIHFLGRPIIDISPIWVFLQWLILNHPNRFNVIFTISIAVLSAYGLNEIHKKTTNRIYKYLITSLILVLIIFEYNTTFYHTTIFIPSFIYKMKEDQHEYAIIEIPYTLKKNKFGRAMLFQTIHEKKLVGGFVSYLPDYTVNVMKNNSFLNKIFFNQDSDIRWLPELKDIEDFEKLVKDYNVKYIIFEKPGNKVRMIFLTEIIKEIDTSYNPIVYNGFPFPNTNEILVYQVDLIFKD